jgi:hypothetical protein
VPHSKLTHLLGLAGSPLPSEKVVPVVLEVRAALVTLHSLQERAGLRAAEISELK